MNKKKTLAELAGGPLNPRKKKGASKRVAQQLILAKLFEEGFIKKTGETSFEVNATTEIEARWGDDGKKSDTTLDIREILERTIYGLEQAGNEVKVKRLLDLQ